MSIVPTSGPPDAIKSEGRSPGAAHAPGGAIERARRRVGSWRVVWIVIAVAGMILVHPWQRADNAGEVAAVQQMVDTMTVAFDAIREGRANVGDFTVAADGFSGSAVPMKNGSTGVVLVAPTSKHCVFMHTFRERPVRYAQVGRLPQGQPCSPSSIAMVPVADNDGYVAGTGPPFDVTLLIQVAWTPFWYLAAMTVLTAVAIKAGLDLMMVVLRPDRLPGTPQE